jgi:hypothetical protein
LPTVLLSVVVVVVVVVSMMIVGGASSPAVAFQQTGHWVFNRSESSVVHVDSGTRQVDARVLTPAVGTDPVFALQGDRQGFLVGRKSITVFGKSTLTVDSTIPTGQSELPVGIEVVGGPYLVYQQAGTIVRLGVPPLTIPIGGKVGRPVYTDDGTIWLHRLDNGALCALRRAADTLDCSLQTAAGAPGALTVTSSKPAFLDTAQDALQSIETAALLAPVAVGTDLPDAALIGDRDTQGRLPAVVTAPNRLVLADTSGVPAGRAGGPPIPVDLGDGQFTSPVAADGVVAVIEQTHNRLLTFGIDGRPLGAVDLPPGGGPASIARGEDGRIYVDDADGAVTHVVGPDGKVTSIKTGGVVTAVVAAPPDQRSLIPPPPQRDNRLPVTGPITNQPGQQPVKLQDPPPNNNPPPPTVDPLPTAPTGVKAVAKPDGSVAVSWNAVTGTGVRYSVQVDGTPTAQTTGTTTSLTGLTLGQTYVITVSATNAAGSGPVSAGVTVKLFGAAASAPKNARILIHEAGGRKEITLFWDASDLAGRDLVGYQVTGPGGQAGPIDQTVTQQGSIPLQFNDFDTYCTATIQYQVRAITTPPGGGASSKGPSASASKSNSATCTSELVLDSGTATSATTATVTFHCTGSGGSVVIDANAGGGVQMGTRNKGRWTGMCAGGSPSGAYTATFAGLSPSSGGGVTPITTYKVVGNVSSVSGTSPNSNTLSIQMPVN